MIIKHIPMESNPLLQIEPKNTSNSLSNRRDQKHSKSPTIEHPVLKRFTVRFGSLRQKKNSRTLTHNNIPLCPSPTFPSSPSLSVTPFLLLVSRPSKRGQLTRSQGQINQRPNALKIIPPLEKKKTHTHSFAFS